VPGWTVSKDGRGRGPDRLHLGNRRIGRLFRAAAGCAGRGLAEARITGALLVRHNEPVLTLGISDADIAAYVAGFKGFDLAAPAPDTSALPPVISRATVSTGVIRDGILRTARTLAIGRGLIAAGAGWTG
jgi:NosR/NirI family nitrite reductase transcriptional regulator